VRGVCSSCARLVPDGRLHWIPKSINYTQAQAPCPLSSLRACPAALHVSDRSCKLHAWIPATPIAHGTRLARTAPCASHFTLLTLARPSPVRPQIQNDVSEGRCRGYLRAGPRAVNAASRRGPPEPPFLSIPPQRSLSAALDAAKHDAMHDQPSNPERECP